MLICLRLSKPVTDYDQTGILIQVLWSNSNWHAIPLANLRDGSQVKKAYQKARLCLHPDKLQQRGGTSPLQKSVASRVFSILQVCQPVLIIN